MDSEESKLLKKSVELAEENNKILRYIKRSMHVSSILRFIYWIFIFGTAVGAYYLIQPYIDQVTSLFGGAKSDAKSFNQVLQNSNK